VTYRKASSSVTAGSTRKNQAAVPFGYGLSYTTFKYSDLNLVPGPEALDAPVTVEFELANTGSRAGAEVAQVYVQEAHSSLRARSRN